MRAWSNSECPVWCDGLTSVCRFEPNVTAAAAEEHDLGVFFECKTLGWLGFGGRNRGGKCWKWRVPVSGVLG
jgi:hypothetical protein